MGRTWILVAAIATLQETAPAPQVSLPVIDMHLHAYPADAQGPPPVAMCAPLATLTPRDAKDDWRNVMRAVRKQPPCSDPVWSPTTDEDLMNQTLEVLRRRNIFGVLCSSEAVSELTRVQRWREKAPDHIIPALGFQLGPRSPSPDEVRRLHKQGQFVVLGEVLNQYVGISPADQAFEPYLALAEERDFPVGIHAGPGPPGAPYLGVDRYRARLNSSLLLEEVLVRHPKLRIYIMHAGWPMLDDLIALLWTHPQVYVDVGFIDYNLPRAEFYRYLQRIVEAGFGKRVMFGSDQMIWPGVIERAIQAIESAPFLDREQKRDILYNNAARFLRLSDAEIAKHHGR